MDIQSTDIKPIRTFRRKSKHVSQYRIQAAERQRRALELRKAGSSYTQIAQVLGYADCTGASAAVRKALADMPIEPVTDLRALQIERLNHMILPLWPKVQAGDERAIDCALRVMAQIDRLCGTEAPAEVHVQHDAHVLVIDGSRDDYIERMKQMAGAIDVPSRELPVGSSTDV